MKTELSAHENKVAEAITELEKLRGELAEKEKALVANADANAASAKEIELLKSDLSAREGEITSAASAEIERLKSELDARDKTIAQSNEEIGRLKNELTSREDDALKNNFL